MRTPKEIFRELVQKAKEWAMFRGPGVPYDKLTNYRHELYSREVGKMITHLPEKDRSVLKNFTAADAENERFSPEFANEAIKRKRRAAIKLVVNNDKK